MNMYKDGKIIPMTNEEFNLMDKSLYEEYDYGELVSLFIHEKYSIDSELAILRQRDIKIDEFEEYNVYCEECKIRARKIKGIVRNENAAGNT